MNTSGLRLATLLEVENGEGNLNQFTCFSGSWVLISPA
jgi:hypothetical protein